MREATSLTGALVRTVRLTTGVILFVFVISHLVNLWFGLIGIESMEAWRERLMWPWSNLLGGLLLLVSLTVHAGLGLHALYRRNTLRMRGFDAAQLTLGLLVPFLLLPHVLAMVLTPLLGAPRLDYELVLTLFWQTDPSAGLRQVLGIIAVWLHACMGLVVWLRLRSAWPALAPVVYPMVLVVPVLALLGFVAAGNALLESRSPAAPADDGNQSGYTSGYGGGYGGGYTSGYGGGYAGPDTREHAGGYADGYVTAQGAESGAGADTRTSSAPAARVRRISDTAIIAWLGLISLTLLLRGFRLQRETGSAQVSFVDGPSIDTRAGLNLLELSRSQHLPHGSLCGGKGRCGTCQVRVHAGAEHLSDMGTDEAHTLARFGVPADGRVRLACQAVVLGGALRVERLLPALVTPEHLRRLHAAPPESLARRPCEP
ncbi:MAG: (2Fe-2S)-binding protein [Gammaproteobacteria bacterium]|nr:(2Fe-2S)-binding protein [Gammaproteobacteria bacterium]